MTNSSNLIDTDKLFRRLALLTVLTIYLLILAGGIVRSTGSGMGCPDWPKCFGQWVPPTNVSQLPANYQEIYAHKGYADTTFNPTKTWIEYLNRLLGALTGVFIFATLLLSFTYVKRKPILTLGSFAAFVLVGVQGWLGAKVVSHLLAPWIVTLHMLLALVIVGLLLYVTAKSYQIDDQPTEQGYIQLGERSSTGNKLSNWLRISSIILLIQILLGTQVRESVDEISRQLGEQSRGQWISHLGSAFITHRSLSWLVLISVGIWVRMALQLPKGEFIRSLAGWAIGLTIVEIGVGVVMAYLAIPYLAQPIHLFIAVILLGIQFVGILFMGRQQTQSAAGAFRTFSH